MSVDDDSEGPGWDFDCDEWHTETLTGADGVGHLITPAQVS
jgi:hypothetical protein